MALATAPRTTPIDLLPEDVRSGLKVRRILTMVGLAAAGLVLILVVITFMQRSAIRAAEEELRVEQAEAARLRTEVGKLREFGILAEGIQRSRLELATALAGDVAWSNFMTDLAVTIPSDSWVTNVNVQAATGVTPDGLPSFGTVKYQGFVADFPGLSNWLTVMDDLDGLEFVYLGTGQKQGDAGPGVSFSANAHLTEAMLSGRCLGEDAVCP